MIADQLLAIVQDEIMALQTKRKSAWPLRARTDAIFRGHRIKITEKRVVLHAALQRQKGLLIMKANIDQPSDPESKDKKPEPRLVSKSDSKDDLKSLPLPEVEKRLGSSAKGLSRGAEAAGAIWSE